MLEKQLILLVALLVDLPPNTTTDQIYALLIQRFNDVDVIRLNVLAIALTRLSYVTISNNVWTPTEAGLKKSKEVNQYIDHLNRKANASLN